MSLYNCLLDIRYFLFRRRCHNLSVPEIRYSDGSWVKRKTTADLQNIQQYLANHDKPLAILQVGIGNSSLFGLLGQRVSRFNGITISEDEIAYAKEQFPDDFGKRYDVRLANKYSNDLLSFGYDFDYIVDNDLSSYACCRHHFFDMMSAYKTMLKQGGAVLVGFGGLGYFDSGFGLSEKKMRKIAADHGLVFRRGNFCYFLERDNDNDPAALMPIKDVIDRLVTQCGCALHSAVEPAPADVDVYAPRTQLEKAKGLIAAAGFVLTNRNTHQSVYRRFENGRMFMIDLIADFNVYTQLITSIKLSPAGNEWLGQSASLHKCFKYLCYQRKDKTSYIEEHRDELTHFLMDNHYFTWLHPQVRDTAGGRLSDLFRAVNMPDMIGWLRSRWAMLGTGYTIAFIGPDGSGKSFFIEKLKPVGVTRTVYMGDWFFWGQKFYTAVLKIPSPYNRFIYGFYIIENYIRLVRVLILRFMGRIVLIDRFPGTNRNIVNDGTLSRINRFIFGIFPKPDMLALLHAPPEVVYRRKQEISIEGIREIQERLNTLLAGTRYMVLDTEQLDISLNKILTAIYARLNAHVS